MKPILIIGMGRFGNRLCRKMIELNNQVMIVDTDKRKWLPCFLL